MHQRSKLIALFMASILSNPTCAFAEEKAFYLQGLGGCLYLSTIDFSGPIELNKPIKSFNGRSMLSINYAVGLGLGYQIPERNLRIGIQFLKPFISYDLPEASVTAEQIAASEPTYYTDSQYKPFKDEPSYDKKSSIEGRSLLTYSAPGKPIERIDIPVDINIFMLSADYSLPMDESSGFFVSVAGGFSYNKAKKPEYFAPTADNKSQKQKDLDFYISEYSFQPVGSISVGLDFITSNESLSMQLICRATYLGKSVAYKIKDDNSAAKYSDIQVDLGWSGAIIAGLKFDL